MSAIDKEAKRLAARFANLGMSREEFAREFGIKGKGAMIYQHITGRKPISLEAGIAYAKGFGCTLKDISPRLAKMVEPIAPENPEVTISDNTEEGKLLSLFRDLSEDDKAMVLIQIRAVYEVHKKKT